VAREMIAVACQKKKPENVMLEVCGFDELLLKYNTKQFDMVFSNFAGLNCVNADALKKLNHDLYELLKPGGMLVIVLLGKKCWTERLFFTLKGEREKARRRMKESTARLNQTATQQTFCYDTGEVTQLFSAFTLKEKKPVGLFIPPSYLEPVVKRNRFLVPLIRLAEWLAGSINVLSDYADHTFIVLQKK
jgi:SAM-dependent methyltransferase